MDPINDIGKENIMETFDPTDGTPCIVDEPSIEPSRMDLETPFIPLIKGVRESQYCQLSLQPGTNLSLVGYGYISVHEGEVCCYGASISQKHGKLPFFSPDCYSHLVFLAKVPSVINLYEGDIRWSIMASFLPMKELWSSQLSSLRSKKTDNPNVYSIFPHLHLIRFTMEKNPSRYNISFFNPPSLWEDLFVFITTKNFTSLLVHGPKSSGKSTFLKTCTNFLLSSEITKQVLFMNLDCGQSEFNPPATISLHLIEQFILGPSFCTQRIPLHQEFVGVISISDDPTGYLLAIEKLIAFYHTNKLSGIPLLINTIGWTSGLGLEIFKLVVKLINPQFIVSLVEDLIDPRDLSMPIETIEKLKQSLQEPLQLHLTVPSCFRDNACSVQSISLLPTSAAPPILPSCPLTKYSPKDLRSLVLLSYFNLGRTNLSPIFCIRPLAVPFSRIKIDVSSAQDFNCSMVGLFDDSTFLGLGKISF